MALDDFVEALAGECVSAPIDQDVSRFALADEQGAAAFEVLADGCERAVGDGHESLPGSVRVRAERGGVKVNVVVLERDRL